METLQNLKRGIVSRSKRTQIEVEIEDKEYVMIFRFDYNASKYELHYYKNKDMVKLIKNKNPVDLNTMSEGDKDMYKEVLDFAVKYYHDIDDGYLKN